MHPQSRPKLGHVRRFDFVIAGAGLAGLTLAAALARRFPERTLLLVDPRPERVGLGSPAQPDLDRTIGFWLAGPPPFAELIEHSFARLRVDGPGGARTLELGEHRYHTLRWATLRDHLLAELRERPSVTRQHGRVAGVVAADPLLAIVDGEPVAAAHAFDSRLELARLRHAPGRVLTWQSFCGLHFEVEHPRFDPEQATFMDLRASTAERLRFLNVVPRSPRAALVYLVEVGARQPAEAMRTALETVLREQHGLTRFHVCGHEAGVLPLSDQQFARRSGRVRRIGIAGGRLKPSTGYAFTRILADNDSILASLETHGHPFAGARERRGYRLLDGVLLDVLTRAPQLGPELFMGLFAGCEPSTVFGLLDERASVRQLLAIMAAMPHKRRLALAGVRRALAWLRAPLAVALAPEPDDATSTAQASGSGQP
jgi:lycopene beta-cyclase